MEGPDIFIRPKKKGLSMANDFALPNYTYYCERCGKKLDSKKIVWVEWDTRYGPIFGPVDPRYTQGWFPYGADCIRAMKKGGKIHIGRW